MLLKIFAPLFIAFLGIRAFPRLSMHVAKKPHLFLNCITFTPYFYDEYEESLLCGQQIEKCYLKYDSFTLLTLMKTRIKIDYRLEGTNVRNSKYYLDPKITREGEDVIYFSPIMLLDVVCNQDEYVDVKLDKIDFEVEKKYDEFKEPYNEDIFHSYWTLYCVKGVHLDRLRRPIQKEKDKPYFPQFSFDVRKDREETIEREQKERIVSAKERIESKPIQHSLKENAIDDRQKHNMKFSQTVEKVSKMEEEIIIL
jgi:hypothetical protein